MIGTVENNLYLNYLMANYFPGSEDSRISFKVVLLGEGAVGKTSLLLRYVENTFDNRHIQTLQAAFLSKKLNIEGRRVNLSIWDTAGQEKYHALGPIYYRDSQGALLVYDITDEDSFRKVKSWVKELRKMLGTDVCLRIIGNKTDLDRNRNVSLEEATQYAESVGAKHFQSSAKLNKGIEEVFLDIAKAMLQKADEAAPATPSGRRNVVTIIDDEPTSRGYSCCGGGDAGS